MELIWKTEGFEMIGQLSSGETVAKIGLIPMVKVNRSRVGLELPSGYGCTLSDKDVWISGPRFSDMKLQCPKAKSWCEAMISLLYMEA